MTARSSAPWTLLETSAIALSTRHVVASLVTLAVAATITVTQDAAASSWARNALALVIWLVTGSIFAVSRGGQGGSTVSHSRASRVLLVLCALLALGSHTRFGAFHGQGRFVHDHEFFHYYMGSKYYRTLGHDGLYAATTRALIENDPSFRETIRAVKNLRTYRLEGSAAALQRADGVAGRFSLDEWAAFRADVAAFQNRIPPARWAVVLVDHGYNASPFWTTIGRTLAHAVPPDPGIDVLAAIDPVLLAGLFVSTGWLLGWEAALLLATFLLANPFADFGVSGGAFLRQLWFVGLVAFVGLYRRGHTRAAAIALSVATLDRVFPGVFALVPAACLVANPSRRTPEARAAARFLGVFAIATAAGGLGAAMIVGGLSTWIDFVQNARAHDAGFYVNQISLRNLFITDPAGAFARGSIPWDDAAWWREKETWRDATIHSLGAVRVIVLVLSISAIIRRRREVGALAIAAFLPFTLFYPADYYYTMFVAGLLVVTRRSIAICAVALALLWAVKSAFPLFTQLEFVYWVYSACILLALATCLARALSVPALRHARRSWRWRLVAGAGVALLATAIAMDGRDRPPTDGVVRIDLTADDVVEQSASQVRNGIVYEFGTAWSGNDHVVVIGRRGASATFAVPVPQEGMHRVIVHYSTSPELGSVALSVNGGAPFEVVDLLAPSPATRAVVHDGVHLRAGENRFTFSILDRRGAVDTFNAALDRIVLVPEDRVASTAAEGVERSIVWIDRHPADLFDGGIDAIADEIAVARSIPGSRLDIGERLDRLTLLSPDRVTDDTLDAIASIADAARAGGLSNATIEAIVPTLDARARKAYEGSGRTQRMALCAYVSRLHPTTARGCDIERSLLRREVRERRLLSIVSQPVVAEDVPSVRNVVRAIGEDIDSITSFGDHAPGADSPLADRAFWSELCDRGVRWAIEAGDPVTTARLVTIAHRLHLESEVPARTDAVEILLRHQDPDGTFGATTPAQENPFREAVFAAATALALEATPD